MFFCKTLPLRDLSSLVLFIFLNKISVSYKKKKKEKMGTLFHGVHMLSHGKNWTKCYLYRIF